MSANKKEMLEALQKLLGQSGKLRIHQKTGKEYYEFSCPYCEEIGHDSGGNHLQFYPAKGCFIKCRLEAEGVASNEHGIKIYNQVKALLAKGVS